MQEHKHICRSNNLLLKLDDSGTASDQDRASSPAHTEPPMFAASACAEQSQTRKPVCRAIRSSNSAARSMHQQIVARPRRKLRAYCTRTSLKPVAVIDTRSFPRQNPKQALATPPVCIRTVPLREDSSAAHIKPIKSIFPNPYSLPLSPTAARKSARYVPAPSRAAQCRSARPASAPLSPPPPPAVPPPLPAPVVL
eukprot:6176585-Pleurochrysis_carterae.AAC.1